MAEAIDTLRVPTAGPTLAVRDHAGGEPAILALHGLGSNARWWDLVAARLAPRHRVVAVDLRGHGLSDKPERGYDFATVVGDLREVMDTVHPGPAVVAGHSWGASVALAFGVAEPARTLGVICIDGGATDLKAYFGPSWDVAGQTMKPPDLRGITPEAVRAWMDSSPLAEGSDPDTAAAIMLGNFEPESEGAPSLRARLPLAQHMQIARALYDLDGFELMARLRRPILFIPAGHPGPEDSPKVRAMDRVGDVLGDRARITWVDGEHDIPVQRPAEVAAAMQDFVNELGDQPSSTSQR